jgi:DNA-directed RNA polymerase subunit K/omega
VAVKPVDIEQFSSSAKDVYEAIVIAAKRARQIHADLKIELSQRIETLNQLTGVTETEDEVDVAANPDQLKISLEFEKRTKPADVALREIVGGKLQWRYKTPEEPIEPPKEKEKEQESEE